jgi:hypothetical protein
MTRKYAPKYMIGCTCVMGCAYQLVSAVFIEIPSMYSMDVCVCVRACVRVCIFHVYRRCKLKQTIAVWFHVGDQCHHKHRIHDKCLKFGTHYHISARGRVIVVSIDRLYNVIVLKWCKRRIIIILSRI